MSLSSFRTTRPAQSPSSPGKARADHSKAETQEAGLPCRTSLLAKRGFPFSPQRNRRSGAYKRKRGWRKSQQAGRPKLRHKDRTPAAAARTRKYCPSGGFGVLSRLNSTNVAALGVGAFAVASAVFLILELNSPYQWPFSQSRRFGRRDDQRLRQIGAPLTYLCGLPRRRFACSCDTAFTRARGKREPCPAESRRACRCRTNPACRSRRF